VASEAGKAILEKIKAETGIYYDIDTFQLVRSKASFEEGICKTRRIRGLLSQIKNYGEK